MGRLTIEIPDDTHHHLKVAAAYRGITLRDYVMEKILPDLGSAKTNDPSLQELAAAWEERRKEFRLERNGLRFSEITHGGHKW